MRPSVSPLLAAFTALHASEKAERMGNLEDAARFATEAINRTQEWRDAIYSVMPDVCTHNVPLDLQCTACAALP